MKKERNPKEEESLKIEIFQKKTKLDEFYETIKNSMFNVLYLLLQQEDEGVKSEFYMNMIELLQVLNFTMNSGVITN